MSFAVPKLLELYIHGEHYDPGMGRYPRRMLRNLDYSIQYLVLSFYKDPADAGMG